MDTITNFVYYSESKMERLLVGHIECDTTIKGGANLGIGNGGIERTQKDNVFNIAKEFLEANADNTGMNDYFYYSGLAKMNLIIEKSLIYWWGTYYLDKEKNALCIFYLQGDACHCPLYHPAKDDINRANSLPLYEDIISVIQRCYSSDLLRQKKSYSFTARIDDCKFVTGDEIKKLPFSKYIEPNVSEVRFISGSPYYVIMNNAYEIGNIFNFNSNVRMVNGKCRIIVNETDRKKLLDRLNVKRFKKGWMTMLEEEAIKPFIAVEFKEAVAEIEEKFREVSELTGSTDAEKADIIKQFVSEYYYSPISASENDAE